MIHSPHNTACISFIFFNPCPFFLTCFPLSAFDIYLVLDLSWAPIKFFLLSDKILSGSSGTGFVSKDKSSWLFKDETLRKGKNQATNPKENSCYVPYKGITSQNRKRNGVCGYRNKWRNSTLFLALFLSSLYCWPMTPVSCGSHGFPTVCEGKSVAHWIFPFFHSPSIQQNSNNDFSLPWVRGGKARKNPESFKSENNFPPWGLFWKKTRQPEHKAVCGFFFPLRRSNEIVFRVMFKKSFLQLNFVPLKFFLWPLTTWSEVILFQSLQY